MDLMRNFKLAIIFLSLFSSTIVLAQRECKYYIFALKHDLNKNIGMDVGELASNNLYVGLQGTIPYSNSNRVAYVNAVYGYGIDSKFRSKLLLTCILGMHSTDFLQTVNLNYGAGVNILSHNVIVGGAYTNREHFSAKIGFYLCR